MSNPKPSHSVLVRTQGLLCLVVFFGLAVASPGFSEVQASTQANTFTYLPMVTKYMINLLDGGFGDGGKVYTNVGSLEFGGHVAVQSDGKILLAGTSQYLNETYSLALMRYNPDGSLDTTFDSDGMVVLDLPGEVYVSGIVVQPDDKIVAAGYTLPTSDPYAYLLLVRFNLDGSLDTSFDGDGYVITDTGITAALVSLALQSDGKIAVAGAQGGGDLGNADLLLARYNPDGSLDASFGGDGIVTTSYADDEMVYALAVQTDGKLVAAGFVGGDLAVLRYLSDGSLDTTFNGDGLAILDMVGNYDVAYDLAIQPDGKIIAAGLTDTTIITDILLARFSADGSLDSAFDGDGVVTTDISDYEVAYGVAMQSDGRIVVGGRDYNDMVLLRYLSNGSLDSSFGKQGFFAIDFDGYGDLGESLAIQSDGKIVMGGQVLVDDDEKFGLIRTK